MTVPLLTDITKLSPHTSGTGASASLTGGKWVLWAPSGGIARLHYTVDFDHTEPFTISGRFVFPFPPPGGGLTCPLRVENYVPETNRPLNRLEIDKFQDGSYWLVRNRLVASGDPTGEYTPLKRLPVSLPFSGQEFDLAMACRLATDATGYTAIYLDGNLILEHEGQNWSSPAMRVQRARCGIIQGGGGAAEVHVLAAKLTAGLVETPAPPPPPPPPEPEPAPEPTDPCAAQNTLLAKIAAELYRTDNTPKNKVTNLKKLVPKG